MKIFMDDSGYEFDWKTDITQQPFFVMSAVCVPEQVYPKACQNMRISITNLNLPKMTNPLGQGFEIKANQIAKGEGWWGNHNKERCEIRNSMLLFPKENESVAFVSVIDKKAHVEKYKNPDDPLELSLQFLFERIQDYLKYRNEYGYCTYDQPKRTDDKLHNISTNLMREGSEIIYWSDYYKDRRTITLHLDRILEFSLGNSKNSVGLQVADFFATMTNYYHKSNTPHLCGWWNLLTQSLYKKNNKLEGLGYKKFPI